MGISKGAQAPPPGVYKDDPSSNGRTSSMSSAMHLNDIEYPEEDTPLTTPGESPFTDDDLPAYTDLPQLPSSARGHLDAPISYLHQPTLSSSSLSKDSKTTSCHYPQYSQNAAELEAMIFKQAAYPPDFSLRLKGTHTETVHKRDNKTEKQVVVDFDIKLSMTHLLVSPNPDHAVDISPVSVQPQQRNGRPTDPPQALPAHSRRCIEVLGANGKGYRGTVFPSAAPSSQPSDSEAYDSATLTSWCESYVSSPAQTKTFTIKRLIRYYDPSILETLCRDLIQRTSYRGHISITFPTTLDTITVYSPSRLNEWRFNPWIYWPIYLTFLWIFTWPFLLLSTKRWEVVTAVFPYRMQGGQPLVQSEDAFFADWKESLRRAVVSRHQGWVDSVYRADTLEMVNRGELFMTVPATGLTSLMAGAVRVALGGSIAGGWGADS